MNSAIDRGQTPHIVDGPVVNLSAVERADPSASLTGTLRSDVPAPMSATLAHVLSMSRAAVAHRLRIPRVSVDEAMFVSGRRTFQE